jgi:hypothetical protein
VEAGKGVDKRAQERTDKNSKSKNEVERALVEKKEIKPLTVAGMGTGEEGAEEGAGALRQFTTKRDLKLAWTMGEDAKKKMETQQKWALEHPKAAYKDHAPLLLQKIEEIRRCVVLKQHARALHMVTSLFLPLTSAFTLSPTLPLCPPPTPTFASAQALCEGVRRGRGRLR